MGRQKLLLPFGGTTVIGGIADQLIESAVDAVCVVVGRDGEAVARELAGRAVSIATNPDPDAGMLGSVRCGLRALPPECEAVLVALGDQPGLTSALVDEMIRSYAAAKKGILAPVCGGKRGHPLLFSARYASEVLARFDETGLRGLPRAHPDDVLELLVTDPALLADMDLPEDYRRALARLGTTDDERGETHAE